MYCENDHVFNRMIRNYPGRKWSQSASTWYISENEESLKSIIAYFKGYFSIDATELHIYKKMSSFERHHNKPYYSGSQGPVKMTVDPSQGRLIVKFMGRYDNRWISELKQYCRPYYDTLKKEWHLPVTRVILDSLTDYFNNVGVQVIIKKAVRPEAIKKERNKINGEIRERKLSGEIRSSIEEFIQFLKEHRYSNHTLDS